MPTTRLSSGRGQRNLGRHRNTLKWSGIRRKTAPIFYCQFSEDGCDAHPVSAQRRRRSPDEMIELIIIFCCDASVGNRHSSHMARSIHARFTSKPDHYPDGAIDPVKTWALLR